VIHVVDLTSEETRYLVNVLSQARKDLLREIHHAATHDFRDRLRRELEMNERLDTKLLPAEPEKKSA
jgi:hypothetical protein